MSRKQLKFMALAFAAATMMGMTACDDDDDNDEDWDDQVFDIEYTITFENAPLTQFVTDTYGSNYYPGSDNQVTTGYLQALTKSNGYYVQFPVNYAQQTWEPGNPWRYTFSNGGCALSEFHDKAGTTYENQMSVYADGGKSGRRFLIVNGSSTVTDPRSAKYSDYDRCAHIYITNGQGYTGGPNGLVGTPMYGDFEGVWVCNDAYTYNVMSFGNDFTTGKKSLKEQNGWFKVQFIGFNSTDANARPVGYREYYLANFDASFEKVSGLKNKIRDGWNHVDLDDDDAMDRCCVMVVNFVGSDTGTYGLNTPAYCALDNLEIDITDIGNDVVKNDKVTL